MRSYGPQNISDLTYIYGRKFTVRTDHRPLLWLSSLKEPNAKLQRWKLKLEEFNFDVEYVKGKDNQVADGLSRLEINFHQNTDSVNHEPEPMNTDNESIDSPVNLFKTQIILNNSESLNNHKLYKAFNKRRIVVEFKECKEKLMLEIMKSFFQVKRPIFQK